MGMAKHINLAEKFQKKVLLVGTAGDVFRRGVGVAYNRDYGTAATREESRDNRVEALATANHCDFAGVLDETVTLPSTGQAEVIINLPGSICDVAIGSDTVINATVLHALAASGAPGVFRDDVGFYAKGAALALQTVTSGKLVESLDGSAVVATNTVTKTGLFAGAAAGDFLVILASSTAAGAAGATPGIYEIDSVTSDDVGVLVDAPGDGDLACYVVSGNPVALCKLLDGEPSSGCIEWVSPLDNAATQSMVGGFTHVLGGVVLGSGDATSTLANGTRMGEKKGFIEHGALGTQDYLITVTLGLQLNGSTDLNTIEMDADADVSVLEWVGTQWRLVENVGPTLA